MASVKKFKKQEALNQLKHVSREIMYPKNIDIDKSRTHLNYSLSPEREMSEYEYLKKRISELEILTRRQDLVYMSGWVITKPVDLSDEYEDDFFKECYNFLLDRYGGEKNVISCSVHKDESGEPHMHFCFVPVSENIPNKNMVNVIKYLKEYPNANNTEVARALGIDRKTVRRYRHSKLEDIKKERLSARDVINKNELTTFHSDLQKYLLKKKIPAKVHTGVTKKQGGNITVEQLKLQREHLLSIGGKNVRDITKTIDKIISDMEY